MNKIIFQFLILCVVLFISTGDVRAEKYLNPFKSRLPAIKILPKKGLDTTSRPHQNDFRPQGPDNTKNLIPVPPQPQPELEPKLMPELTITGLIWNSDRPQAIINAEVVGIGDIVSEVEIISINKKGVAVSFDGRTITISP